MTMAGVALRIGRADLSEDVATSCTALPLAKRGPGLSGVPGAGEVDVVGLVSIVAQIPFPAGVKCPIGGLHSSLCSKSRPRTERGGIHTDKSTVSVRVCVRAPRDFTESQVDVVLLRGDQGYLETFCFSKQARWFMIVGSCCCWIRSKKQAPPCSQCTASA